MLASMRDDERLEGTSALVTGASRGLGKEVARALAARGARVVMVARDEQALERAAADVRASVGPRAQVHVAAFDVGDKEAAHRIAGVADSERSRHQTCHEQQVSHGVTTSGAGPPWNRSSVSMISWASSA